MSDGRKRIAVALDASERSRILELARLVGPEIGVLKVGLEAFCAHGPELVREVAALAPVFLDLKLHDIPNTVGAAAAAAARTGAAILNVHAGGGAEMMRAAGERAREAAAAASLPVPRVIAVTVLTSLDAAALSAVGLAGTPRRPPFGSPSSRGRRVSTASSALRRRSRRSARPAARSSSSSFRGSGPRGARRETRSGSPRPARRPVPERTSS